MPKKTLDFCLKQIQISKASRAFRTDINQNELLGAPENILGSDRF